MPLPTPPPIESERLLVRLVHESDVPELFEINRDPEVTRFLPYANWQSLADGQAWFKRMNGLREAGGTLQFVIVQKTSNVVIGSCLLFGFEEKNATAELGYVLGRAHWGNGYMHEALTALIASVFQTLGLRRLEAQIGSRNPASERTVVRLGFTREGQLRQRWMTKDGVTDAVIYGLLRHEWAESKR